MKSFYIQMEFPLNNEEEVFLNDSIQLGKVTILGVEYKIQSIGYDFFPEEGHKMSYVTISGG